MPRSDLLISLVKAGSSGDRRGFRSATEAIIAEERAKRHDVLANTLASAIEPNGTNAPRAFSFVEPVNRGRDFITRLFRNESDKAI